MGAWGLASDENDDAWNAVGLGIEERINGFSPLNITNHKMLVDTVRKENPGGFFAGVVVWLLKVGCVLSKQELEKGLKELQDELDGTTRSPYCDEDKEERNAKLRQEISMISAAMEKGYVPDQYLVGVLGIYQVRFNKGDGTPWHQPARRLDDGTLVPAS